MDFFSHSTPIRPTLAQTSGKSRTGIIESHGGTDLVVPNEEVLNHKKYLMVIHFICQLLVVDAAQRQL